MPSDEDRRAHGQTRTARASVVVAGFTALSRVTGLARVLLVAAVLGPTALGNSYQLTNTLPNLIWYGFLAGSLVSSVLVPVLVRHLEAGTTDGLIKVSRAFLGVVCAASLVVMPLGLLGVPFLLDLANAGVPAAMSEEQVRLSRLLVMLTLPQVVLYAVVGTANAVLHARGRFALAAVGPSVENAGVMVVLVLVALGAGDDASASLAPTTATLVLLGGGSTAAVGLNAALQWWGARRAGVTLFPAGGWRDREVMEVIQRAGRSVACAGLLALQTLVILLLSSRVSGGTVALQISLNFYALPIALITTPIGLALLPQLSRAWQSRDLTDFRTTFLRGLAAALFLAVPASVAYVLLAQPLAEAVASGRMSGSAGEGMIAASLAALAVGLAGQAFFFVTAQAAYAAGDARTPLECMAVQAAVCVGLSAAAVMSVQGQSVVPTVAGCYALATLIGGALLLLRVAGRWPELAPILLRAAMRTVSGVVVLVAVVVLTKEVLEGGSSGRTGAVTLLVAAGGCGVASYLAVARALRSPELDWWISGLRRGGRESVAAGAPQ